MIKESTWIEYAKTLSFEELIEVYVNQIEEITCDYNSTNKIKKTLEEFVNILN